MSKFGVIQSKCGKMQTRITPNKDTFYALIFKRLLFFQRKHQFMRNSLLLWYHFKVESIFWKFWNLKLSGISVFHAVYYLKGVKLSKVLRSTLWFFFILTFHILTFIYDGKEWVIIIVNLLLQKTLAILQMAN